MLSFLNPLPSIPAYRGPYKVGTSEFEIPVSEIPSATTGPDERITTIKFRLYYPTTKNAASKQAAYWLPEPQHEWNNAYASFMGADSRYASVMSRVLGVWNYAKLPAVKDAPLAQAKTSAGLPVCIFSHGLGGNFNTYSSVVGNLASCGVFCIATEHRDGSAPISFVKNAKGEIVERVPYQKHAHTPTPDVLNARNAQLRIRLWEMNLTYSVIEAMNEGRVFTNYAETKRDHPEVQGRLDLRPGQVTWAGHSFGAATTTQFVKSVYYHGETPATSQFTQASEWDMTPLIECSPNSKAVKQITPDSPVALLDLWTMPLGGETTRWLRERPMPSYFRQTNDTPNGPNTVAVISAEFYKWPELRERTRAILSQNPGAAFEAWQNKSKQTGPAAPRVPAGDDTRSENPIPELNKQERQQPQQTPPTSTPTSAGSSRTPSPSRSDSEAASASSSATSLVPSESDIKASTPAKITNEPHLYLVPQSAHLSQSDFGILFPNLTKYVMKAIEPEKTLELNVRAVLGVMKYQGLDVESLVDGEDSLLEDGSSEERWVRVPLVDA